MFSDAHDRHQRHCGDRFNRVRVALGQNYTDPAASLWYPPATIGNSPPR